MTRINTCLSLPPKPNAVSLCELAIAAGTTGQSVAVHFQDFPAHVVCQLWQIFYELRRAGASSPYPQPERHSQAAGSVRQREAGPGPRGETPDGSVVGG